MKQDDRQQVEEKREELGAKLGEENTIQMHGGKRPTRTGTDSTKHEPIQSTRKHDAVLN